MQRYNETTTATTCISTNAYDKLNKVKEAKAIILGDTVDSIDDKVKEYKDVLAFYDEPPLNYRYINDSETLLRMIFTKYEMRLKGKGYTTEVLKKIYNSQSAEDRERYEELLKTLDELAAEEQVFVPTYSGAQ